VGFVYGRIEPFGDLYVDQLQQERSYFARAARRSAICQRFGRRWWFVASLLFEYALLVYSASIAANALPSCEVFTLKFDCWKTLIYTSEQCELLGHLSSIEFSIRYSISANSLKHSSSPTELQLQQERTGCRQMQENYHKRLSALEFYSLALFERFVLHML
jgi:hypothetical protein